MFTFYGGSYVSHRVLDMRSCAEDNIPQDQRRLLKKGYHARSLSQYLRMNDENTAL